MILCSTVAFTFCRASIIGAVAWRLVFGHIPWALRWMVMMEGKLGQKSREFVEGCRSKSVASLVWLMRISHIPQIIGLACECKFQNPFPLMPGEWKRPVSNITIRWELRGPACSTWLFAPLQENIVYSFSLLKICQFSTPKLALTKLLLKSNIDVQICRKKCLIWNMDSPSTCISQPIFSSGELRRGMPYCYVFHWKSLSSCWVAPFASKALFERMSNDKGISLYTLAQT